MRFHKFPQEKGKTIAIDLDRIYAVRQEGENRAWVFYGTDSADQVIGRFDDILALISPPAAPDKYEADLAKIREEGPSGVIGHEDRPWTADEPQPPATGLQAVEHAARLDELERTVSAFWGTTSSFRPRWVQEWTDKRRAEIREGKG